MESANDPSTAWPEGLGLLRVDPDRRFLTLPSKAGLGAAKWVKINTRTFRIYVVRLFCLIISSPHLPISVSPHHPINKFATSTML
jgi:hypothetical protein